MYVVGDIVTIFSPVAGYPKYHLCVCAVDHHGVTHFLYINSHDGWEADFKIEGDAIDCLPKSRTGKSVISCNTIARYNEKQLVLFQAKKIGELPTSLLDSLISHVMANKALNRREKQVVLEGLESLR